MDVKNKESVTDALRDLGEAIGRVKFARTGPDEDMAQLAREMRLNEDSDRAAIEFAAHTRLWERYRDLAFLMGKERGFCPPVW